MDSQRIRIERKGDQLDILIRSMFDSGKQRLLNAWIILWTLAGLGVAVQFFLPHEASLNSYLLVWIAFWTYFEYRALSAFRWRKWGAESLHFDGRGLTITKKIRGRGIPQTFEKEWIRNLRRFDRKRNSFFQAMSTSYWNPGNERVLFNYKGREIYFGLELNDAEVKEVISPLKHALKD